MLRKMKFPLSVAIAAFVLLCLSTAPSHAAVSLGADNRFIVAETNAIYNTGFNPVQDPEQHLELAVFTVGAHGPYAGSLTADSAVNHPQGLAMASANAAATQNSSISTAFMDFSGTASGDSFSNIPALNIIGHGTSHAGSQFSIVFSITQPANYTLNGTVEAIRSSGDMNAGAFVRLTPFSTPNTHEFNFEVSNPTPGIVSQQIVINNHTGTIAPGTYAIFGNAGVDSLSVNTSKSGSAEYDLTFTLLEIPEPASGVILACGGLILLRRRH